MPRFLFGYVEFMSYLGRGTPEDPGGDFSMSCWIEAPDKEAALQWGHALLGDYFRERFAQSPSRDRYTGNPVGKGSILEPEDDLYELLSKTEYTCRQDEVPKWIEPWRRS